jgi:hypothetical protein
LKCFSERAIQPDRGGAVAVQGRDIKAGTGGRTASGTGTAVSVDSWNPFTIDGVIYQNPIRFMSQSPKFKAKELPGKFD